MEFVDIQFSREYRFCLGTETQSGKHYLSIPVSNQLVDYEEFYEITEAQFALFRADMAEGIPFADDCRNRRNDRLLFYKPGSDRGVAT